MKNLLAQIQAYDPTTDSNKTLRLSAAHGYGTDANGQFWLPCLTQGPKRDIGYFSDGKPQSISLTHGQLGLIIDHDLGNDDWSALSFDGADVQVWVGDVGQDFSNYKLIFTGKAGAIERDGKTGSITLLGPEAELEKDLLKEYAGTGGLEGDENLKGNLKPRVFGNCQNLEPRLIDQAYQIYHLNDGAVASIDQVYENAYPYADAPKFTVSTWADLRNAALNVGEWASAPAIGCFRLGGQPAGKITADSTGTTGTTIYSIITALLTEAGASYNDASLSAWALPHSRYIAQQITYGGVVRAAFDGLGIIFPDSAGAFRASKIWGGSAATQTLRQDRTSLPLVQSESMKQITSAPPFFEVKIGHTPSWAVNSASEISEALKLAGQDAATAAQNAADAASAADAAQARLASMADDNTLDRTDKYQVITDYNRITLEQGDVDANADSAGVNRTAYDNAVAALTSYLTGLSPSYNDTSADTTIVGTTFRSKFQDVYNAKAALENAISVARGNTSTWVGVSGSGKPQDNATVGAQAGSNLTDSSGNPLSDTEIKNSNVSSSDLASGAGIPEGGMAYKSKVSLPNDTTGELDQFTQLNTKSSWYATGTQGANNTRLFFSYNAIKCLAGGTDWCATVLNQNKYAGGCHISARVDAMSHTMWGLTQVDSINAGTTEYFSLNYSIYNNDGLWQAVENSVVQPLTIGAAHVGDVGEVRYQSGKISYWVNGQYAGRTIAVGTGLSFRGGIAFYSGEINQLSNIDFGPIADAVKLDGVADNATAGATWGTNVANRPAELTDGRITTALQSDGFLKTGLSAGGTGAVANTDLLGSLSGSMVTSNPEFRSGAWYKYNNTAGSAVTLSILDDTTAPNSSGKVMNVRYDGSGAVSPGFGGWTFNFSPSTSGTAQRDHYTAGAEYIYVIKAKIPTGRYITFASNAYGSGSSFNWLTATAGTGAWQTYVARQRIGTSGTFSTTGFFFAQYGADAAFDWQVAQAYILQTGAPISFVSGALAVDGTELGETDLLNNLQQYSQIQSVPSGLQTQNLYQGSYVKADFLRMVNGDSLQDLGTQWSGKTSKLNTNGRISDPTLYNTQAILGPRSLTNLTPSYTASGDNWTVNLPAHDRIITGINGPITLHYGATSAVWPASSPWVAYYIDADLTGLSSPTLYLTADSTQTQYINRYRVAFGTTPAATSSGGTSGGGSSGTGPGTIDNNCVAAESYMPDGRYALDVKAGDQIVVLDESTWEGTTLATVTNNFVAISPCVEIISESGIRLVLSNSTPCTLRGGETIKAPEVLGHELAVQDKDGFRWEKITSVRNVGNRPVSHISANNGTYAAGAEPDRMIFTHNVLAYK